jgi:hypothetical protein
MLTFINEMALRYPAPAGKDVKQTVFTLKLMQRSIVICLVLGLSTRISGTVEVSTNHDAVLQTQNTIKCFLEELLTLQIINLQMPATTVGYLVKIKK